MTHGHATLIGSDVDGQLLSFLTCTHSRTPNLLRAAVRDFSSFRSGLADASPDFENCLQPKPSEGRLVETQLGPDRKPVYNPVSGAFLH